MRSRSRRFSRKSSSGGASGGVGMDLWGGSSLGLAVAGFYSSRAMRGEGIPGVPRERVCEPTAFRLCHEPLADPFLARVELPGKVSLPSVSFHDTNGELSLPEPMPRQEKSDYTLAFSDRSKQL